MRVMEKQDQILGIGSGIFANNNNVFMSVFQCICVDVRCGMFINEFEKKSKSKTEKNVPCVKREQLTNYDCQSHAMFVHDCFVVQVNNMKCKAK